MDIQYCENPFPHVIIDNFLPKELYNRIKENMETYPGGLSGLPEAEEIRKHFGDELEKIRNNLLKQVPNASAKEMTPNDYIIWANRQFPYAEYKNHNDSPWKRLSTVLYIGRYNQGTLFHESNGEKAKIVGSVEWKENRAMSFVPSTSSHHSYANKREYFRDTVLINMGSVKDINREKNTKPFSTIFNK